MGAITECFSHHHKSCDDAWVLAEDAVAGGNWGAADQAWKKFHDAMQLHLGHEESQLFPAFEAATGLLEGPTTVMRMEHTQLRALFSELSSALVRRDAEGFAGAGQTLLILMQQHNLKEEKILYPMCDRALEGDPHRVDRLVGVFGAGGMTPVFARRPHVERAG